VSRAVALRGVEPDGFDRVIQMSRRMKAGAFRVGGEEVVIGAVLADELGLAVGDKLRVTSAESRADLFTVAGVFDLGSRDVNQRWVLVSLRAAQTLLDLQGGITGIELKAS
jgi:lipoprotein-releasing system permease protein